MPCEARNGRSTGPSSSPNQLRTAGQLFRPIDFRLRSTVLNFGVTKRLVRPELIEGQASYQYSNPSSNLTPIDRTTAEAHRAKVGIP